jgi:hypothetical protein
MPKNKLSEYSSTAGDNTDIGGINIAEGMAPSDVNNAMREQMSQLKDFIDGSSGDTITTSEIVATTATILSGQSVTGTATFNSAVVMSSSVTGTTASFSGATTIGGAAVLSSTLSVANTATMGVVQMADNNLVRPTLLDYCVKGSALGSVGTLATIDVTNANFFSATLGFATTFAFTNPCTTGDFGGFILELTNGGSADVYWPAAVDFPGGTAPTLTAAGVDLLVFVTRDSGTTYHGMVASADSKTPA